MGDAGERQGFPTTDWTLIKRASRDAMPSGNGQLDQLVKLYLPSIRYYLLVVRHFPMEIADDIIQGFFADKVLGRKLLASADQSKGRFRNFLVRALNNYIIDRQRRDKPSSEHLSGPIVGLESVPSSEANPEAAFDQAWARSVLIEAIESCRSACERADKRPVWEVLNRRILRPTLEGVEPESYASICEQFAIKSPEQAANILVSAKRLFRREIVIVLQAYLGDKIDSDREIASLYSTLASARPRS